MPRITGVVKGDGRPLRRYVAGIAIAPEVCAVIVVFLVAADAGGLEPVRERFVTVTGIAAQIGVATLEHEARVAGVVE